MEAFGDIQWQVRWDLFDKVKYFYVAKLIDVVVRHPISHAVREINYDVRGAIGYGLRKSQEFNKR